MFCQKPLGGNEVVESFPVGRRLAFDSARGRLWVVCLKCERWNLTPLEERWEAVEDCERIFRGTRVRVSTENIGLARHPEGLTLVRVGRPLRPEFAAWRYGDQLGRRRRRAILYTGAVAVALGGAVAGGVAAGVVSGSMLTLVPNWVHIVARARKAKLRITGGQVVYLNRTDIGLTRIRPADDHRGFKLQIKRRTYPFYLRTGEEVWEIWFEGGKAHRIASAILPKINSAGAGRAKVKDAVDLIERAGHPAEYLTRIADGKRFMDWRGAPGYVAKMPHPMRLALEMSLHEEQERRALEGELWVLERAWREAEEVAGISDNLFLPEGTDERLRELRDEAAVSTSRPPEGPHPERP